MGSALLGLPYLDAPVRKGTKRCSLSEAMYLGHLQFFPKARHVSRSEIQGRDSNGRFRKAFDQARALAASHPDTVKAAKKPPADLPPFDITKLSGAALAEMEDEAGVRGNARWTMDEWARIAREEHRLIARGDTRSLPRIVHALQWEMFPLNRRRRFHGIKQGVTGGALRRYLDEGYAWGRENIPGYMLPGPLPTEATSSPTTASAPISSTNPPTAPAQAPTEAAAPPVVPVLEMVTRSTQANGITSPPRSPISTAQAVHHRAVFAHASTVFASTITGAVDQLLQAHAAALMGDIEARLSSIAASVGASVAQQVENGLRSTVMATLAQELGGPVAEPVPPSQAESPAKAPETPQAAPKAYGPEPSTHQPEKVVLRADVLGFQGNTVTEIKNALNGRADLRFIVPEHVSTWTPRDKAEVFIATRFSGHNAERRCSAFNIRPHRVDGAGTKMILELEKAYHQLVREVSPGAVAH